MQVSGRVIIFTTFGLALAMSGGAWLYHYSQVRQAAAFWGHPGGRLLVRGPRVAFYEFGAGNTGVTVARRSVARGHDLSESRGLVHLRHALYYDANLDWADKSHEPLDAAGNWKYAIDFRDATDEGLIILFPHDFSRVGKVSANGVDVVPSPRIAASVKQYLTDIGVLPREAATR